MQPLNLNEEMKRAHRHADVCKFNASFRARIEIRIFTKVHFNVIRIG